MGQQDSDELEGTGREAAMKGKEWEALALAENDRQGMTRTVEAKPQGNGEAC